MKYYLIGIKGSGMAALANILLDDNYVVEGCDVDSYIFTESRLKERNVNIYTFDNYYTIFHIDVNTFLNNKINIRTLLRWY